jgi:hypothetical protein
MQGARLGRGDTLPAFGLSPPQRRQPERLYLDDRLRRLRRLNLTEIDLEVENTLADLQRSTVTQVQSQIPKYVLGSAN